MGCIPFILDPTPSSFFGFLGGIVHLYKANICELSVNVKSILVSRLSIFLEPFYTVERTILTITVN